MPRAADAYLCTAGRPCAVATAIARVADCQNASSSEAPRTPPPSPSPRVAIAAASVLVAAPNVAARSSAGTRASRYMFANAAHAADPNAKLVAAGCVRVSASRSRSSLSSPPTFSPSRPFAASSAYDNN